MKLKHFLVRLLFNKRQRYMMHKALVYSAYVYRKRGNVDKAVSVQIVLDEVSGKLGVVPETYTKEEVESIVNRVISDAEKMNKAVYLDGVKAGKAEVIKRLDNSPLAVGTVIDLKKCECCKHKNDCFIVNAISEIELEENQPVNEQPSETEENHDNENSDTKIETETEETTQN